MATYKKPEPPRTPRTPPDAVPSGRSLGDSAQRVWLAGLGALSRAQEEGSRLFDTLVREGARVDRSARAQAGSAAEDLRDNVESTVEQTREQASATWDRMEHAFDERFQRALTRLGVPTRHDIAALNARIDALNAQLQARAPAKKASRAGAPRNKATAPPPSAQAPTPAATPASSSTGGSAGNPAGSPTGTPTPTATPSPPVPPMPKPD